MGVEARHKSGKLYYYKKRREGGRVVSEYVGGGILVDLEQRRAENERAKREADREQLRIERMSMAEIDQSLDRFSNMVDTLMAAELISMGFHQHKRQWRRRRNGSK